MEFLCVGKIPKYVLLEETNHYFSVWTTHPSWMNSSKAAHSDTNWGHWHCRATKDRMGSRSSAPLRDESRKLWGFAREENTSKHLSVNRVTFTKFDDPFFPGDWKESKSIGAPNGCVIREIFWGGRIPAWRWWQADSILLVCRQWPFVYRSSHAGLTAFLLACVRRRFAGLRLTRLYATGYSTLAGSGGGREARVSAGSRTSRTNICKPKL